MGYYNDMSLGETCTTDDDWYDRKDYGRVIAPAAPSAPVMSDLPIPRTSDIIDRALDNRAIAVHRADDATVRQLDRLIAKLPFARLCWQLGTLLVSSPSGHTYHVTRAGCDCENGRKCDKRQCWHVIIHELLLDLFETACETADMEAEPPALWPRVAAARTLIWAAF